MALSAQPTEWSLGTGITHNKESIFIVSDLLAEVEHEKIAVPLLGKGYDEEEEFKPAIKDNTDRHSRAQAITFVLMVIASVGNKVFQKLQTLPFRNYPTFVTLFTSFVFILVSFAYIIPVQRKGVSITPDQVAIPKRVFVIMGALDAICGIFQVFAATYLNGSLLILLSQSTIPFSMLLSALILKTRYSGMQLIGACVVAVGIIVVVGPTMGSEGLFTFLWSIGLILSCVPMVLSLYLNTHRALLTTSSIYKEAALGQKEMDAIYLLGWTTAYQFLISIPLTFPIAELGDPPVPPSKLPENLWDGLKCFVGFNTVTNEGKYPDDCWPGALTFFTIYMVFNIAYNILIIYMLKLGSATSLYLALTISVPIGNMVFALPFVPGHNPVRVTDYIGMVCIFIGLTLYRFVHNNKLDLNETGPIPLLLHPLLELGDSLSIDDVDCDISRNDGAPESAKNPTKDDSDCPEHVDL